MKLEVLKLLRNWPPGRDKSLWNVLTFKRPVQIALGLESQCEDGQARKQTKPGTETEPGTGPGTGLETGPTGTGLREASEGPEDSEAGTQIYL